MLRIKKEKINYIRDISVKRFRFENGLRVLYLPRKVAPVFSYQTWYNVGSRDEETGYSGIAHFLEHLMFRGTKDYPSGKFDRLMESNGARDLNAFTSMDYTAYVQSLPKEKFDLVAKLEADRMRNLKFTEKQFQAEKDVIHNERKQRIDNNPEGQMYDELNHICYPTHPYRHPIIGYTDDLNRIQRQDCMNFYRDYYAPNNAVIVVTGDVAEKDLLASLEKHYGKLEPSTIKEKVIPEEKIREKSVTKELSLDIQMQKAYVAYQICNVKHKDLPALNILSAVLTTGRSSRLFQKLVRENITLDIGSFPGQHKDIAQFIFSFTCQMGKTAHDVLKIIDREIHDLRTNGATEIELKRAKNKLTAEIYYGIESNQSNAHIMGQSEILYGDLDLLAKKVLALKKVKAEEVKLVVKKYFSPDNRCVVVGLPKEGSA